MQYAALFPVTSVIIGKLILSLNPGNSYQVYGFLNKYD